MKTRQARRKPLSIAKRRWAAYAAANVATTLAGSDTLEAAIHYSGRIDATFPPNQDTSMAFQLDQPGDFIFFRHFEGSVARFFVTAPQGHGFRGYADASFEIFYVSKLSFGDKVRAGSFRTFSTSAIMAEGDTGQWLDRGMGFIGFMFNNGAGDQYGWVRVKMAGSAANNGFKVLDYAYADPGEPIRAGQRSDHEMVTDEGSLGWLALGAAGVVAWRKSRTAPDAAKK